MLTLPQKMYLLSYDLDRRKLIGGQFRGHLMRAAALAQLTIDGHLHDENGKAVATWTPPPSDPFLAEVLASAPGRWRRLVDRNHRGAQRHVLGQLADDGVVSLQRKKVLGLFPGTDVIFGDTAGVLSLRETVRNAVLSTRSAVPDDVAAMVALASAAELNSVFSGKERRANKARVQELSDQIGAAAPALKKAIAAIRAAMTASAAAASSSGGN